MNIKSIYTSSAETQMIQKYTHTHTLITQWSQNDVALEKGSLLKMLPRKCNQSSYAEKACWRNFLRFGLGFCLWLSWNFARYITFYAIQRTYANWCRSHVTYRNKKLKWCHLIMFRVLSYFWKMKHGFPHRLILGPLLFIMCIQITFVQE